MEGLLSLATLATVSGGLLFAANKKKEEQQQTRTPIEPSRKKEGFDVPKDAVRAAFPSSAIGFIEETARKYNPLMNSLDPRSVPVLPANYSRNDVKDAQSRVTSAVQKMMASSADPSYTLTMNQLRDIQVWGAESSSRVKTLQKCEDVKTVNCDAFNDPTFQANCGVCHEGGKDSNAKDHIGGLLITKDGIEAAETIAIRNKDKIPTYMPSIGSCPPGKFSVTKEQCKRVQAQLDCEKKQNFDVPGCSKCVQDDRFYFLDSKIDTSTVFVWLAGKGTANVSVIASSDPSQTVTLSGSPQKVEVDIKSDSQLLISVQGIPRTITVPPTTSDGKPTTQRVIDPPFLFGYISGKTANGEFRVDLNTLADRDAITGRKPRITGSAELNGENVMIMSSGKDRTSMNIYIYMPYTFMDPTDKDIKATCPGAPFITNAAAARKINSGPCYAPGSAPGAYTMDCLQTIFVDAGCSSSGSGYPSTQAKADQLQRGKGIGQIASYVADMARKATTGRDSTGSKLSTAQWDEAANFCTGERVRGVCDGGLTKECLSYLYNNMGAKTDIGPTYSGTGQCSPDGTMAPNTPEAISAAAAKGSVAGVKAFYDSLQKKATDNTLKDSERAEAMKQCYGVNLNPISGEISIPPGALPGPIATKKNLLPSNPTIRQGNKIATVYNSGNYELSFIINLKGIQSGWANIIRFNTQDGNCCTPGQRMPAIWLWPGRTSLHVRFGTTTDGNWGLWDGPSMPLNSDIQIIIKAIEENVSVEAKSIDNKSNFNYAWTAKHPNQRPTGTCEVWVSDKYHVPINGTLRDLSFFNVDRTDVLQNVFDSPMGRQTSGFPEVFHVGQYNTRKEDAQAKCAKYGADLASPEQLRKAWQNGADWCSTGWIADSDNASYPINKTLIGGCGYKPEVVTWTPSWKQAGVNCFGVKPKQGTADVLPFSPGTWNDPVSGYEPPKTNTMGGPAIRWNQQNIPVMKKAILSDSTVVYMSDDGGYIKMVSSTGEPRYYVGRLSDFDPNKWKSYTLGGPGSYILRG